MQKSDQGLFVWKILKEMMLSRRGGKSQTKMDAERGTINELVNEFVLTQLSEYCLGKECLLRFAQLFNALREMSNFIKQIRSLLLIN